MSIWNIYVCQVNICISSTDTHIYVHTSHQSICISHHSIVLHRSLPNTAVVNDLIALYDDRCYATLFLCYYVMMM